MSLRELWYPEQVIYILNAVARAAELQGPEYHKAIADIAQGFGVQDQLNLPSSPPRIDAGYRVNDGHQRD